MPIINIYHLFYFLLPLMNSQYSGIQAITFSFVINFLWGQYKSHWAQSLSFQEIFGTSHD